MNIFFSLFGDDASKVFVHHVKSPVHSFGFTRLYIHLMTEKYGITFIVND